MELAHGVLDDLGQVHDRVALPAIVAQHSLSPFASGSGGFAGTSHPLK
jgi:hypothetical protein